MNLKKTSKGIMKISITAVVYIAVIIAIYQLASKGYGVGQEIFSQSGYKEAPGKNITVTITSSMSDMDVAKLLEDKEVVKSRWIFFIQSWMYKARYKEGKYKLNNSYAPEELVKILSKNAAAGEENTNDSK